MAKTYGVYRVRYHAGGSHIDKLEVSQIVGTDLMQKQEMSRPEVVDQIKNGDKFYTLVQKTGTSKLSRGAEIDVFPVMTDYLKTKADSSTKDNLENLPKF